MKLSAATLLLSAAASTTSAYEIGCIYPPTMPEPFEARYAIHEYSSSYFMHLGVETPLVIHISSVSSYCQANCVAYHDDQMLNPMTMQPPLITTPPEYHNSYSRMLCMAECHHILGVEAGRPEFLDPLWEPWGLKGLLEPRKDIVGFALLTTQESGNNAPLRQILEKEDWHPFTVGQIVASEILLHVVNDGWNALGNFTYDVNSGKEVPCTANCLNYKDTYGYFPQNYPTGKPLNDTEKYIVEGKDRHWQPLTDNDGEGFFVDQQHVTPHIGYKAVPKLFPSNDDFPEAPDPNYDFRQEALQVVDRLKETSSDPIKKQKIAFYDNKLLVINLIENVVKQQFQTHYTFEEEVLYVEGMAAGEHDATLMAWREKVRHDVVRPTTVIQRWGDDVLDTFGGHKDVDHSVEIKARDFQAFQRVMPHAEYPSGSSCICTAYTEFTDAFTLGLYNGTIKNLSWGAGGEGTGFGCDQTQDPPLFVSKGCEDDFVIPDLDALLHECSQSRLWAGFHFTAAVTEGEKMCAGIGLKAWDHVKEVRNGSDFGSSSKRGDPRPQCPSGEFVTNVAVNRDGSSNAQSLESSGAMTSKALPVAVVVMVVGFFFGI